MVDDVVHDDADAALMRFGQEGVEVGHGAVVGIDGAVIILGVAVIVVLAGTDRHQPDAGDAERLQIVEL